MGMGEAVYFNRGSAWIGSGLSGTVHLRLGCVVGGVLQTQCTATTNPLPLSCIGHHSRNCLIDNQITLPLHFYWSFIESQHSTTAMDNAILR